MIRDGLNLRKKVMKPNWKSFAKREYKENLLSSVIQAQKMYRITKIAKNFGYIRDPYGILLLMEPTGVPLSGDDYIGGAEYPQITAKEYYEAVKEGKIHEILPKMTAEEKLYCNLWAKDKDMPSPLEVVRGIAYTRDLDWKFLRNTWEFQPDPVAFAFGLASDRLKVEQLTPVIGIPYVMIIPSDLTEYIRFPVAVWPDGGTFVQIHKEGDLFEIWDQTGDEVLIDNECTDYLRKVGVSYVAEARLHDGRLDIVDLLCWNDIWMFNRTFSERYGFLWHFEPYVDHFGVVSDWSELNIMVDEFNGHVILKNFNKSYLPSDRHSHIYMHAGAQSVRLRVGGRQGGKGRSFLNTEDKKAVFEIPVTIDKEDWGDIVEVKKDGTIIQILEKGVPDGWSTVAKHFKLNIDYKKYKEGRRLPKCNWIDI